ncbi:AIPR family protein [Clostridium butyricum]
MGRIRVSNINQFKLVQNKSELYYKILERELGKSVKLNKESDKARFGFYYYMLECLTGIKDTNNISNMITDTDFNKVVFNKGEDDCGIDAVYIDEEDREIKLFNFKYRERFKADKIQSENELYISTKFTNAIINEKTEHLEGKLKDYSKEIIEKIQSKDIWKIILYMVSNEDNGIEVNNPNIEQLRQLYDLEIRSIALPEISNFMSIRPEAIDSKLILDKESILSYTESSLVSAKSYLIKVPVSELIRITCNNKSMREKYNIENIKPLNNVDLDFAILFDNVRGFLGSTKYNKNIFKTLSEEPTKFFMYNNGITITAEDIIASDVNGKKKLLIEIKNFQVVNGGQTLRTVHNFNQAHQDNLENYLCDAEILVRIFKTGKEETLTSKIAEYTNSQNEISIIDLKSIATEQMQIEQILNNDNIIYARKIGNTGIDESKNYDYKISLEKFAQIVYSKQGNPEKASNDKKKIFEKHYEETFGEENFDISQSPQIVRDYYKIKEIYEGIDKYNSSDQKIFYIIYLNQFRKDDIKENIDLLEECLNEYRKDDAISHARKLIQIGFRKFLDYKCGIGKVGD